MIVRFPSSAAPPDRCMPAADAQALQPAPRSWMCDACEQLLRSPPAEGHTGLRPTGARKQPGGLSSGVMFQYRCSACRFVWMRVADSASGDVSWVGGYAVGDAPRRGPAPPGALPRLPDPGVAPP